MSGPLPSFLTFTCHGTWLHADERGSVAGAAHVPGTPVLPPDPERQAEERKQRSAPPYWLDSAHRPVTWRAIGEIARRTEGVPRAVPVRSNHVPVG